MAWFMLYSKGSVRQSRRHQALELAVIFFLLTGLYQCGLNLYLNDKATKENGGGLLLTVTGSIFSSYGVVVCFSVASLFVSEIEWMTAMMGLIGTSFGLLLNQLLLSYTVVFLSVNDHFLDGLFCKFLDALNFPHPLCTALKLNIAGSVLLFSGLALSVLFGWLRLWEMFAHQTSATDRYHHNVHPSVFYVIRFLTFISYVGLIVETATSMKMVDEQSAAGLSVAQPLGSDYILALAIGAGYTVGHQRGQFRLVTGGCGVAGLCYISTFFINVRALHNSDAGLWCEDPHTNCTVLTSSVVAQGIIAFAQLSLALIGLRFYFYKLYPDDDVASDGQAGVSVHQRYGVPNSDGYHEIAYRADELREPIVDQS